MIRNRPQYLHELAQLSDEPLDPAWENERRGRMIGHIDRLVPEVRRREASRRRWLLSGSVAAAAAAVALLGLGLGSGAVRGWLTSPDEGAELSAKSQPRSGPAPEGGAAEGGGTKGGATKDGRAVARDALSGDRGGAPLEAGAHDSLALGGQKLASGSLVEARGRVSFAFAREEFSGFFAERVELERGALSFDVPSLEDGRVVVETAEARVETVGARFEVEHEDEGGERVTRVSVAAGEVAVQPQGERGERVTVSAGERWTSAERAGAGDRASPGGARAPGAPSAPAARGASLEGSASVVSASELAEQNRLYQSAVLARRQGLPGAARERFSELLRRYPSSPLADSARRELGRLEASPEPGAAP